MRIGERLSIGSRGIPTTPAWCSEILPYGQGTESYVWQFTAKAEESAPRVPRIVFPGFTSALERGPYVGKCIERGWGDDQRRWEPAETCKARMFGC